MKPDTSSPTRLPHRGLGIALAVLGGGAIAFASMGLLITTIQSLMMRAFEAQATTLPPEFLTVRRVYRAVLWTHMPLWLLGGAGLAVVGLRLFKLRAGSIGLARAACAVSLAAVAAYVVDASVRALPAFEAFQAAIQLPAQNPRMALHFEFLQSASLVMTTFALVAPYLVILWGLRRRRPSGATAPSGRSTPARG